MTSKMWSLDCSSFAYPLYVIAAPWVNDYKEICTVLSLSLLYFYCNPHFIFAYLQLHNFSFCCGGRNMDAILIHWQNIQNYILRDSRNVRHIPEYVWHLTIINNIGTNYQNTNIQWHFWNHLMLYFSASVYIVTALQICKAKHKTKYF